MTTPLVIDTTQNAVVSLLDAALENSFKDGTECNSVQVIPPIDGYTNPVITGAIKSVMKDVFRSALAALLVSLGIEKVFPASLFAPLTGTNTINLGGGGSLTVVDGIVTAQTTAAYDTGTFTIYYDKSGGGTGTLVFTDGRLVSHT